MCEYYGLPLALIFEELVDMDKPEDKAQEQRPAEAEQEQQSKGTANNQPPPLCLQQIDSRRPLPCIALYAAFMRLVVLGYSRQLKRPLAASRGLVWPCVCSAPSWYYRRRQGLLSGLSGTFPLHRQGYGHARKERVKEFSSPARYKGYFAFAFTLAFAAASFCCGVSSCSLSGKISGQ